MVKERTLFKRVQVVRKYLEFMIATCTWAGLIKSRAASSFALGAADFKEQQNAIQELVLSRGHFCIFLPKFHPELNFIERYWSRAKWYAR